MIKNRFFAVLALLMMSGFLSGCVTTHLNNIKSDYRLNNHSGEGVLLLSATQVGVGAYDTSMSYYLKSKSAEKTYRVSVPVNAMPGLFNNSDFSGIHGKLFAVSLPAGEYELVSWRGYSHPVEITPRFHLPISVTVTEGKATYAGNIFTKFISGKNLLGVLVVAGANVTFKDSFERDLPLINTKYPQIDNDIIVLDIMHEGEWPKDLEGLKKSLQKK